MKYLTREIYANSWENTEEWIKAHKKWLAEFKKISSKFPKDFVDEFNKREFHDYNIESFEIYPNKTDKKNIYNLKITILSSDEKNVKHIIILEDITKFSFNTDFSFAGCPDWLYCEILSAGRNKFSIEICLFTIEEEPLYVEFKKLKYKKEN